jgi:hypothetical protein
MTCGVCCRNIHRLPQRWIPRTTQPSSNSRNEQSSAMIAGDFDALERWRRLPLQ